MNKKDEFINAGFKVPQSTDSENKLLRFLKEHFPNVISDNELKLDELKAVLGLPIDEKVNGYGLNFVGRNFAKAKYAQKTEKELRLNTALSKNIDTTQNLVLKGDNLESLKILKNHYTGKIKCIYIDPPYNTTSDEFVYPDRFNKEEAEVLGFANLSDDDFTRMEFSFKTKKSHNGWLAFMYPRLLLARDLLAKDGVIFISIDDNEQANLKLLCDEVFGEENFVANMIWKKRKTQANLTKYIASSHEYIFMYSKNKDNTIINRIALKEKYVAGMYKNPDNDPRGLWRTKPLASPDNAPNKEFELDLRNGRKIKAKWRVSQKTYDEWLNDKLIVIPSNGQGMPNCKLFLNDNKGQIPNSLLIDIATSEDGSKEIENLLGSNGIFSYPKPVELIKRILQLSTSENDIILDFFAGSGTTGHAVMELNAEDGGNRKFILCQIDEPIKKDKPAYDFCVANDLPPVISSITIERLKRAGEKIKNKHDELSLKKAGEINFDHQNNQNNNTENNTENHSLDTGFKVFDSANAPKLEIDATTQQISIIDNDSDALSRIYNMMFTVGLDAPTQVPESVVENCIYKIDSRNGSRYYLTNSDKISPDDYANAIKNATAVFIDGWTASLNGTLQHYKEEVKIIF